jgi:hypothetical protein
MTTTNEFRIMSRPARLAERDIRRAARAQYITPMHDFAIVKLFVDRLTDESLSLAQVLEVRQALELKSSAA